MKQIDQIRELLFSIEKQLSILSSESTLRNIDALEIPEIIRSVVDFLQPKLLPYEAVIYWYLFRKSVLSSGEQYVRISVRGMQNGVITSASGQSEKLSYGAIQKALKGLVEKEVIIEAGNTNRQGTLYKINTPSDIPYCVDAMSTLNIEATPVVNTEKELDFYNIKENRIKIFERDDYRCKYCNKKLTRMTATLDHIQPVSKGGDNSCNNLVTACLQCNSRRTNRPIMDFLTDETVE